MFLRHKVNEAIFMDERQLVKQLKTLKAIKPNKDWANFTRTRILGKAKPSHGFSSWSHITVGKPAWVLASLIIVGVGLIGSMLYFNGQQAPVVVFDSIHELVSKITTQGQNNEQVVASLGEMQLKLEGIKASLNDLRNAKDQNQALVMAEVVRATAERGEAIVNNIKNGNGNLSKQVLASLVSVEEISKELKEESHILQKELFEEYLQDLKQRSLSERDMERLEKAEKYYQGGQEAEAMILISKINN